MSLKVGGLCSGIGGIEYAFTAAGFNVNWMVEINEYCQSVLSFHWPMACIHSDIHAVGRHNLSPVDVLVAGFPCQPYSKAGKRKGATDERDLWPQVYRVVSELRPRVFFFENVDSLNDPGSGGAFIRILQQLAEIGYDAEWTCLRASDFGAPHQRERLFTVAYTDRYRRPESATGQSPHDKERHNPSCERGWSAELDAPLAGGQILGDASRTGLALSEGQQSGVRAEFAPSERTGVEIGRRTGLYEPGLGTGSDGLPGQLVGHHFPAGQGAEQYLWEPPRIIAERDKDWKEKVTAIGNAVVPQVIYPIAVSIREYLEGLNP